MKFSGIALALASTASAQTLLEALAAQPGLSALVGLLNSTGVTLPTFQGNVTLLAPSNEAISAVPNATLGALAADSALLAGTLSYHILQGSYANITNATFVPTYLTPEGSPELTNVTGGQRVHAVPGSNSTTFFTGLLQNSTTVNNTITFNQGVIHIINRFLTVPVNVSSTAISLGLSSAAGALIAADLVETVDTTPDLTLFIPNNAAFRRVASALQNATVEQVAEVLQYHVVSGLIYSTNITANTTVPALAGGDLNIVVSNGTVFVNNARVVRSDVLVSNGVIHVIDSVLNPANATATSSGNSTADAFAGASSATADVFTSGVPAASTTINTSPLASGTSAPSSSSGLAAIQTAGVAMAALFGGAAAVLNM